MPSSSLYEAVEATCNTRAFVHYATPTSTVRQFAEIRVGDAIVDMVIPLVSVATVGNTSLTVGQVLDIPGFNAANNALSSGQTLATFTNYVHLEDLPECEVDMYASYSDQQSNTRPETWVQARMGDNLVRSWETVFAGLVVGHAVLLRKKT